MPIPKGIKLTSLKKYPEHSVFIVGGGHFGGRAAEVLSEKQGFENIFMIDENEDSLSCHDDIPAHRIKNEGIDFLVDNFRYFDPDHTIVPAVPVHLAFLWLKAFLYGKYNVKRTETSPSVKSVLPNALEGSEGSLLTSYADFLCPDDCPEPDSCTVTGARREMPLFKLIKSLEVPGFEVYVLRSRQLAPGVGGYKVKDMSEMLSRISGSGINKWILGTSCKCHGILTSFEIEEI